jgi:endonuclease YncB( thermonuclease family)
VATGIGALTLFGALFGAPLGDVVNGMVKPRDGCRVWQVVDGDTVRMHCPASGFQTGRIIAYDTPEVQGACISETARGLAATYYLRWLLWTGGHISARTEGADRYGRRLTILIIDGQGVARRMVEAGLARWYDGGRRASWCG